MYSPEIFNTRQQYLIAFTFSGLSENASHICRRPASVSYTSVTEPVGRIAGTHLGVNGIECQKEGWRGALQATKFVVSCSRSDVLQT